MRRLVLVSLYASDLIAKYLLSSYSLKASLQNTFTPDQLEVTVLNMCVDEDVEDIHTAIADLAPDMIGYSCYVWNVEKVEAVAGRIASSGQTQIFGGPEISIGASSGKTWMPVGAYLVEGEGESKIVELVSSLLSTACDVASLPPGTGVVTDAGYEMGEDGGEELSLAEVPSVYLTGAMEDRLYARQQAFMETQRGCMYRCRYCIYHKNLRRIKYFPMERVVAELDHLILEKRVMVIRVFDPIFTSDLERAKEMVRHLKALERKSGARLPLFYWEYNFDSVDREFLVLVGSLNRRRGIQNCADAPPLDRPQHFSELLRDYGAINCVGVQSFNQDALRAVGRRKVDSVRFDEFLARAREENLALKLDFILGLPRETLESYLNGLDRMASMLDGTDHVLNIHRLQILPGTALADRCAEMEVRYEEKAPYQVISSGTMNADQICRASKVTAVMSRCMNSPLRPLFLEASKGHGGSVTSVASRILDEVLGGSGFQRAELSTRSAVDDEYWNGQVYQELGTTWLQQELSDMVRQGQPSSGG